MRSRLIILATGLTALAAAAAAAGDNTSSSASSSSSKSSSGGGGVRGPSHVKVFDGHTGAEMSSSSSSLSVKSGG